MCKIRQELCKQRSGCACIECSACKHVEHRKQMPPPWLYEREGDRGGRESGFVCIGAFQQGLCSLVAVVPHRSTVRHPEGYKDNKAVVKFDHFQCFMLTFANSLHMAICVSKVLEREVFKYTQKGKMAQELFISDSDSWQRRPVCHTCQWKPNFKHCFWLTPHLWSVPLPLWNFECPFSIWLGGANTTKY